MSRRARLLNRWLRLTEKRFLARAERPEALRRRMERTARIFCHPPRGTQFCDGAADGRPVSGIRVIPPDPRDGPLILYLHGGGYLFGSPRTHRAMVAHLAARTRLAAFLPRYRLAPEAPFPAAFEDGEAAYRAVMDHPGGVILGGDSAGGGLALALLARICAQGLPQPLGTFCFSPLTDLTFSGESFTANAQAEAMLPAARAGELGEMYLQGADARDSRASPLFGAFVGAGPVWLTAGDSEILLDDTRRMAERLIAHGVDVTCVIEHELPHVWPMMHVLLPEARQTLAELTGWITCLSRL